MSDRIIQEIRRAQPSRDGDGVAIQRIAGMQHAAMDPILMLDELRAERREDLGGGFPSHPHRGMQTLTYMKHGGIIHEDSRGNRGEIRGGGVQWMSAGRGIIHSEMPTQDTEGLHGFQLWVNLPAAEKMAEPRYRDIPASELTVLDGTGFRAVAIAGEWQFGASTVVGPLHELAPRAGVLDLHLQAGAEVTLQLPATESVLAYIYEGVLELAHKSLGARHLLVTSRGERWTMQAGAAGASLLLLRGEPLREPVAQYGPFVMNTEAEIEQAISDYQRGLFG
ncbi:pirin family protein [Haliea sp. E1-2-M8]|uniref:pirin family protein n=1 Tax=Haliea sp. E1-2-M8 TaxID=3064706 RepID=UPI002726E8CF|nr:pirin family protein [Haliea sp. E1-2-M8]MDO8862615.1 pirin family protein [Haliea sp. E1-2-M8]